MGIIKEEDLKLLPIEQIRPNPLNNYELDDPNGFLCKTIDLIGLSSTLGVIGPFDDGCYELITGERRYHAAERLNEKFPDNKPYDMVPVLILGDKNTNPEDQLLAIEICNLTSRNLSPAQLKEHRLNFYHVLESKKKNGSLDNSTVREFAKTLGLTERTAEMYQSVVRTASEFEGFEDIVKNEDIPIAQASAIGKKLRSMSDDEKAEINSPSIKQKLADASSEKERNEILKSSVLGDKVSGELQSLKDAMLKRKEEQKNIPDPSQVNFRQTVSNRLVYDSNNMDEPIFPVDSPYPDVNSVLFDENGVRSEYIKPAAKPVSKTEDDIFCEKMIAWCKKVINKVELSETEQEVVEAFRKLVDKF